MRLFSTLALGLAVLPQAIAWGGFGHITIAYIASDFVSNQTASHLQSLLRNDSPDYLARVATWADSIRYTKWGSFTRNFHFIDAKDDPPNWCGVDYDRDCKDSGCVVSALANYTSRLMDDASALSALERAQAAKFVVHFVGDIHQPLHDENVARGGNGIHVLFDGVKLNLHHVWDSSIAEKWVGGVRRQPYGEARRWADELGREITDGKFKDVKGAWLDDTDLRDIKGTALRWAGEGNAYVCSTVFPEGPDAIAGQELGSDYYDKAAPVVEAQIAKAGFRLAAWLDLIVSRIASSEAIMSADL